MADTANHRIQKFTSDGTFIRKWGKEGTGDGNFSYPVGVAVDAAGNVYVVDSENHRIQKFTADGTLITKWGTLGDSDGQFNTPAGIAVDSAGNVYVTDQFNWRIQKFEGDGTFITKWTTWGGQFAMPFGIAVDASGNVYVSEPTTHSVYKVRPTTPTPPAVPVAAFTASPRDGSVPLVVQFTDESTGDPTAWSWEYRNGVGWKEFSTEKNPTYTFTAAGNYTIRLTATNVAGSDTYEKLDYIRVTLLPPTIERIEYYPRIPVTGPGNTTTFTATINEVPGFEITGLKWYFLKDNLHPSPLDELLGGKSDPALSQNKTWMYGEYGEKRLDLRLYGHKTAEDESYLIDLKELEFKVFFPMGGPADWKTNTSASPLTWARDPNITRGEPNWYHYWKQDGAVDKIEKTIYDPRTRAAGYYRESTDTLALGRAAPVLWPTVYLDTELARVPNSNTFIIDGKEVVGGTVGIKGATATVFHEIHHQTIANEPLFKNLTDSDYNITELRYIFERDGQLFYRRSDDGLPDVFENGTLGTTWEPLGSLTFVNHTDTYNFRSHFNPSYITYGDQEYLCYREENRALGRVEGFEPRYDYTKDWSDGGRMAAEQAGTEMPDHPGIISYQDWRRDQILASPSDHPDLLTSHDAAYGFISYHDYGEDTSGNGLFNTLNIDVTFSVQYPGLHGITGQLTDPDGSVIARADYGSDLPVAGTYQGTLSFDGSAIHLSGTPGPYRLDLMLELLGGREAFTLIEKEDAYTTAAYSLSEFEGSQISLANIYDDAAIDENDDGIYDVLRIDVGVLVETPGRYRIAAGLYKASEYLTTTFTDVAFEAGSHTVRLRFGGRVIGINGIDGPYELRNVVVICHENIKMDYAAFPYTTQAYTAGDFLPSPPTPPPTPTPTPTPTPSDEYEFVTKWGIEGTGAGQFNGPVGIAVDATGNVYVTDWDNSRVQIFDNSGNFIREWGSYGTGSGQFNGPWGFAIHPVSDNIYVTDQNNNRVQVFDSMGTFIKEWGEEGTGNGQFRRPRGIAIDSTGNVYVVDSWNHRIQKFESDGTFIRNWGAQGDGDGQFDYPMGIAVDAAGTTVYVVDSRNYRIQKFTGAGTFVTKWGAEGSGNGQLNRPNHIALDSAGNVYVADRNNHRIQKFTSDGTFITKWGTEGSGNGQFNGLRGVAVDATGYVYVADRFNNRIQKFGPVDAPPPVGWTGVFGNGHWFVNDGHQGVADAWHFGAAGDEPFVLGDGRTGVFGNGHWFVNDGHQGVAEAWHFGAAGDIPFVLADGRTGVFGNGHWFVNDGHQGVADAWHFGASGDRPFVLADGRTGVFGNGHWFVRDSATGGIADTWHFGASGDIPFVLADGRTGVFGNGYWFVRDPTTGGRADTWHFGSAGDRPVTGIST